MTEVRKDESVRMLIYTLVGVWVLDAVLPPYWRVCRTPPPVWWQRAIPLGVILAAAGLASAGLIALWHRQLGDALELPLYIAGLALSIGGSECLPQVTLAWRARYADNSNNSNSNNSAELTPPRLDTWDADASFGATMRRKQCEALSEE